LLLMEIQDLNIIIGEYLYLREIKILSKIFEKDDWNVYDLCCEKVINNFNFNFFSFDYDGQYSEDEYRDLLQKDIHILRTSKTIITTNRPSYNSCINGLIEYLPKDLHTLILFKTHMNDSYIEYLPEGLHTLNLSNTEVTCFCMKMLPKYLHTLCIGDKYNKAACRSYILESSIMYLPKGLRVLYLRGIELTNRYIKYLPEILHRLHLSKIIKDPKLIKNLRDSGIKIYYDDLWR
jgi:hypothetical protein